MSKGRWVVAAPVFAVLAGLASLVGCATARQPVATPAALPPTADSPAAEPPLTGPEILARYVDATGGRAAYEQLSSRVIRGSFDGRLLFLHVTGTFTTWQKHPRMLKTEAHATLFGRDVVFIAATDGASAWQGGGNDVKMLDGARRDGFIRQADLRLVLAPQEHYPIIEYRADETFNGVPCRKVELQTPDGDTETRFYAADTGLLSGMSAKRKGTNDSFTLQVGDYEDVGGIKEPTRFEFSIIGGSLTWRNDVIEHNVEIDDSVFAPPRVVTATTN